MRRRWQRSRSRRLARQQRRRFGNGRLQRSDLEQRLRRVERRLRSNGCGNSHLHCDGRLRQRHEHHGNVHDRRHDGTCVSDAMDATVECDGAGNAADLDAWLASNGGAIGNGRLQRSNLEQRLRWLENACGPTGAATVTFTATDDCGNATSTTATFTIEDTTAPAVMDAMDATVECDGAGNAADLDAWLASNGGATATDACSGVTWSNDYTADGTVLRSDEFGNSDLHGIGCLWQCFQHCCDIHRRRHNSARIHTGSCGSNERLRRNGIHRACNGCLQCSEHYGIP